MPAGNAPPAFEYLRPVCIDSSTRASFEHGDLSRRLLSAYSDLFDSDDLGLVAEGHQAAKLIKNWMAAIDLLQRKGFRSLQDPYFKPNHVRKHEEMRRILPAPVSQLITRPHTRVGVEPPNLLAFQSSATGVGQWRFVQVISITAGRHKPPVPDANARLFAELVALGSAPIWIVPFQVGSCEGGQLRFDRLNTLATPSGD